MHEPTAYPSNVHVTRHAIRRYAERILGRHESVAAADDCEAIEILRRCGVDVENVRARLQRIGEIGCRYGAPAVIAEGGRMVIHNGSLVTVKTHNAAFKRRLRDVREAA